MSVTLQQKELAQDTWERVESVSGPAARLFYDRLFEINPQLRALFPAEKREMEEQGSKLMQMITIAVRGLDDWMRSRPPWRTWGVDTSRIVYAMGTMSPLAQRSCGC